MHLLRSIGVRKPVGLATLLLLVAGLSAALVSSSAEAKGPKGPKLDVDFSVAFSGDVTASADVTMGKLTPNTGGVFSVVPEALVANLSFFANEDVVSGGVQCFTGPTPTEQFNVYEDSNDPGSVTSKIFFFAKGNDGSTTVFRYMLVMFGVTTPGSLPPDVRGEVATVELDSWELHAGGKHKKIACTGKGDFAMAILP